MKIYLLLIMLFLALCGLDFNSHTQDIFRDGKIRFTFLMSIPLLVIYLKRFYGWGMSLFISYIFLYFTLADYPIYQCFSVMLISLCLFVSIAIVNELKMKHIENAIIFCGLFQAVQGICQYFFEWHLLFHPERIQDMHEVVGNMGQHTVLGSFLALCMAPALWRKMYLAVAIMAFCTILTTSSMGIGSMIVICGVYAIKEFGLKACAAFWGLIAVAGLCLYLYSPHFHFNGDDHRIFTFMGRLSLWPLVWPAFKEHPWIGSGIGSFAMWSIQNVGNRWGSYWDKAHSEPYQMLIEQGIIGASFCVLAIIEFIKEFRMEWYHALIVGLLVNSLANFPFHLMTHSILFCIAWIYAMGFNKKEVLYEMA